MRDINDDMDDLFRRAADNYPLNTNSSDWNKVKSALESPVVEDAREKKRRLGFLWLLLLLPAAFFLYKYGFQNPNTGNGNAKPVIASSTQNNLPAEKAKSQEANNRNVSPPSSINKTSLSHVIKVDRNRNTEEVSDESNNKSDRKKKHSLNQDIPVSKTLNIANNPKNDLAGTETKNSISEETNKITATREKENPDKSVEKTKDVVVNTNDGITNSTGKVVEKGESKIIPAETLQNNSIAKIPKQAASGKNKSHAFYIGVIAGPDFSTVKLDKINKTGITVGVIAGYRLNKKLSIESGLLFDKKYYYSEGKYFNSKHLYLPSYTTLDNVDGDCHMIELPLNVKIDFASNKKANWFALAGVSSYFMKKENYTYRYEEGGWPKEKSVSLKDASQIWASVMNLSLGYSHNIGKTGNLRIEPYIKMPIRNIGIGSLPITSAGIYFGFTKNLF
jgi:hypothetical protein